MTSPNIKRTRVGKLEEFKKLKINPYPYSYPVTSSLKNLIKKYKEIKPEKKTEDKFSIAGRITLYRDMGKLHFMTIQDENCKFQLVFMKEKLKEKFDILKLFDLGDIIGAQGTIFKTKKGELSLLVENFELLCKCLVDIGDKFHGVKDVEMKYRNRSLDMITNSKTRQILKKRFLITQKVREFMIKKKFLEVETPIAQRFYGGASAKPFTTFHNAQQMELYLRVSLEQSLKRVMVGGQEAIFEIGKNFRNESIDRTHNPEFTMMEAYKSYVDYGYMMKLTEELMEFLALEILGTTLIEIDGRKIDVKPPWKKISVKDALKQAKGFVVDEMTDEELFSEVEKIGEKMNKKCRGEAILILFEKYGEPLGVEPTHFIDYPKESTPFCKIHREDSELIERCESFIFGVEISNMYSELNDSELQRKLLEEQAQFKEEGAEEVWGEVDEDFLEAMELGLPPCAGVGVGIDRICMVLLGVSSIRDIIYFPVLKPKSENTKL